MMEKHVISQEEWREYQYEDGYVLRIEQPAYLYITDEGQHRVVDCSGIGHYIPRGWRELRWFELDGVTF